MSTFEGNDLHILSSKLSNLKVCLKDWNHNVFGNIKRTIQLAEQNLHDAEKAFNEDPSPSSRENLPKIKDVYLSHLENEVIFWKQKSRIKYLSNGDANTSYFHAFCKNRHYHLHISKIKDSSGILLDNLEDIRSEAVNFFSNLFSHSLSSPPSPSPNLFSHIPTLVLVNDYTFLDKLPTIIEVKEVASSLDRDSLLGPDGFSGAFFVHC